MVDFLREGGGIVDVDVVLAKVVYGCWCCMRLEIEFVRERVSKGLWDGMEFEVAVDEIVEVGVAVMAVGPNVVMGMRVVQPLCEQQSTPGVLGKSLEEGVLAEAGVLDDGAAMAEVEEVEDVVVREKSLDMDEERRTVQGKRGVQMEELSVLMLRLSGGRGDSFRVMMGEGRSVMRSRLLLRSWILLTLSSTASKSIEPLRFAALLLRRSSLTFVDVDAALVGDARWCVMGVLRVGRGSRKAVH